MKAFLDYYHLALRIIRLVKDNPNDGSLGTKVRAEINSFNINLDQDVE